MPPAANAHALRRSAALLLLPETAAVHLLTEAVLRAAIRPLRSAALPEAGGDDGVIEFEAQPSSGESVLAPIPGLMPKPPAPPPARATPRLFAWLVLFAVLGVAGWESARALMPVTPTPADWQAAAALVRAGFAPGDLVVFAPDWADPVGRAQLGDLMPLAMVGRPDARRYSRIWEISLRGAHAPDVQALPVELSQPVGGLLVARYPQRPVTVTYDLVEKLLEARVTQAPPGAATPATPPAGETAELPCLWSGPVPSSAPPHGPAGAFSCPRGRVERRTLEIDYRPRYGIEFTPEPGQRTVAAWDHIPDAAWQGARLWLWLGLHDYHARKTATGAAEVTVDLDHGALRVPLRVEVAQGLVATELPLTGAGAGPGGEHSVRIEVSAPSRTHFVGVIGELRRGEPGAEPRP